MIVVEVQNGQEIWRLDESCILRSEIGNSILDRPDPAQAVQSEISDFGFEMQESSNFEISPHSLAECGRASLPDFV